MYNQNDTREYDKRVRSRLDRIMHHYTPMGQTNVNDSSMQLSSVRQRNCPPLNTLVFSHQIFFYLTHIS